MIRRIRVQNAPETMPLAHHSLNVVISSSDGFIGIHLAERLVENNHDAIVLEDLSTGRMENSDPIQEKRKSQL